MTGQSPRRCTELSRQCERAKAAARSQTATHEGTHTHAQTRAHFLLRQCVPLNGTGGEDYTWRGRGGGREGGIRPGKKRLSALERTHINWRFRFEGGAADSACQAGRYATQSACALICVGPARPPAPTASSARASILKTHTRRPKTTRATRSGGLHGEERAVRALPFFGASTASCGREAFGPMMQKRSAVPMRCTKEHRPPFDAAPVPERCFPPCVPFANSMVRARAVCCRYGVTRSARARCV